MSVGFTASTSNAHIAPSTSRSAVVTGAPFFEYATTILASLRRKSARSAAIARIAITSEATVM